MDWLFGEVLLQSNVYQCVNTEGLLAIQHIQSSSPVAHDKRMLKNKDTRLLCYL